MPTVKVYWSARDLDGPPVGNHQFILITFSKDILFPEFVTQTVGKTRFITLGAFRSSDGKLVFEANNRADVMSVKEHQDPGNYTSWWKPDYDLEAHEVTPPTGNGQLFAQKLIRQAKNYERNTKTAARSYSLLDENCASWVNSMFKKAGVSRSDRMRLGEFSGFDWGEEDEVPLNMFD